MFPFEAKWQNEVFYLEMILYAEIQRRIPDQWQGALRASVQMWRDER